jgi:hypothetical protein
MTIDKVKVYFYGKMVINMREHGLIIKKMEWEYI